MNIGKYIFVVLMLLTTAFFSSYAFAHPPQDMVLQYDIETEILSVTITNNTPAQNIHYVNKIEIRKNNQIVVTELYESQPTTLPHHLAQTR